MASQQSWINNLFLALASSNQRVVVNCEGDFDFCQAFSDQLSASKSTLVVSDNSCFNQATPFKKTTQLLGQEFEVVIYDAFKGFDVDAFTRVAGLIKAPGVLLLIHPQNKQWLQQTDCKNVWQDEQQGHHYFIAYLQQQLNNRAGVIEYSQYSENNSAFNVPHSTSTLIDNDTQLSTSQLAAWQVLQSCIASNTQKSVVIMAARGRGKSTLLGKWLSQAALADTQFIITSDSKKAAAHCLDYVNTLNHVSYQAIDVLLQKNTVADCILVDEAATIPIALLQQLRERYQKIIYSTTNDGYEGTGRGFELHFLSEFKKQQLQTVSLNQPMRWGDNDLLESWFNESFMLQSEKIKKPIDLDSIQYQQVSALSLSSDIENLKQIFNLLKSAHYRTQASDLRMLLDNPDLTIFTAVSSKKIVGVLLLTKEGGLKASLCADIAFGKRRPQGHLLAQVLTVHAGCEDFAKLSGYRIQRIAVAKECRQQGIGSALITQAEQLVKQEQGAYLGAVFALDEQRIQFWQSNAFQLMYLNLGAGTSTGQPSVSLLKTFDQSAFDYADELHSAIKNEFPERLLTHFKNLPINQVLALLSLMPSLGQNLKQQCDSYMNGFRGFDHALPKLRQYVLYVLTQPSCHLTHQQKQVLVQSILQYQAWPELIKEAGLSGKKQFNEAIKQALKSA